MLNNLIVINKLSPFQLRPFYFKTTVEGLSEIGSFLKWKGWKMTFKPECKFWTCRKQFSILLFHWNRKFIYTLPTKWIEAFTVQFMYNLGLSLFPRSPEYPFYEFSCFIYMYNSLSPVPPRTLSCHRPQRP